MSISNPEPQVIDERRHNFTIIDNEVFDLYAQHIGPQGLAIYCALIRFAHQDSDTFPSHANIAKKSGMSVRSVQKYLPSLTKENEELGKHGLRPLVEVRHRRRDDGGQTSNLYVILPVAKAAPPPRQTPADPPRQTPADDKEAVNQEAKDMGAQRQKSRTARRYGSRSDDNMTGKDGTETGQNDTNTVTPDVTPTVIQPSYSQPSYRGPQPAPKDFTPDPDTIHTLTTEHAFTPSQISAQVPLFVDYHTSRGNRMADWQAAFRSWMHKAREYGRLDANQPRYSSGPQYLTAEPPGYEGLLRMREEARRKGLLP